MQRIRVSLGLTKKIAGYEFVRIDAEYATDVPDDEDADEIYKIAWAKVDEQLDSQLQELAKSLEDE